MKNIFLQLGIIVLFFILSVCFYLNSSKKINDIVTQHTYTLNNEYLLFNLPEAVKNELEPNEVAAVLEEVTQVTGLDSLFRTTNYTAVKKKDGTIDVGADIVDVTFYTNAPINFNNKKSFIANNVFFYTKPFKELANEKIEKGYFFVKTNSIEKFSAFILLAKQKFSKKMVSAIDVKEFEVSSANVYAADDLTKDSLVDLTTILFISGLFLSLFTLVWLFSIGKQLAIYKMNGYSIFRISSKILLKKVLITFAVSAAVLGAITANQGQPFSLLIGPSLLFVIYALIILSMVSFLYKRTGAHGNSHEKEANYLFFSLIPLKVIVLLISITQFSTVSVFITDFLQNAVIKTEKENDDYGVFYPMYVGKNPALLAGEKDMSNINVNNALFPSIKENDHLFFDYYHYESSNYVLVNENYINQANLLEPNGQVISLGKNLNNQLLLLSESVAGSKVEILNSLYLSPDTEIQYIKNNQAVQTLDPTFPEIKNISILLVDPFRQGTEAARNYSAVTGSSYDSPLKVKLIDGDAEKTYRALLPLLKEHGVDDYLLQLVKISDIKKTRALCLIGGLQQYLIELFIVLILVTCLVLYTCQLYFKMNKREIAIKKMHGFSFVKIYKKYFFLEFVQYSVLFFLMFQDGKNLLEPLIIFISFVLLETLVNWRAFLKLEQSNQAALLEGE